jgi:hypothetical protein
MVVAVQCLVFDSDFEAAVGTAVDSQLAAS